MNTTDAAQLREAIHAVQRPEAAVVCGTGPGSVWIEKHHLDTIIDAAEAWLATLPKTETRWGVFAGYGWVHFDTFDEALAALVIEAKKGVEATIRRREVPA